MHGLSLGMKWVCDFAAAEAFYGKFELIEPEHLFVGICKVGNLAEDIDWQRSNLPPAVETALRSEIDAVISVFSGHDRVSLYRELRQRKGSGSYHHRPEQVLHRSGESLAAFNRAKAIAETLRAASLDVTHLFAGMLEDQLGVVARFLNKKGVDLSALRRATLNATIVPYAPDVVGNTRIRSGRQMPAASAYPKRASHRRLR